MSQQNSESDSETVPTTIARTGWGLNSEDLHVPTEFHLSSVTQETLDNLILAVTGLSGVELHYREDLLYPGKFFHQIFVSCDTGEHLFKTMMKLHLRLSVAGLKEIANIGDLSYHGKKSSAAVFISIGGETFSLF